MSGRNDPNDQIDPSDRSGLKGPNVLIGRADKTNVDRFARSLALAAAFVVGVATASNGQQASSSWQMSVSTFVSEGNYGTEETTRLTFTALSLRRSFAKGDVSVRVPWLDVRSSGTVVVFQGVVYPALTDRLTRAGARVAQRTTRESGVGDVAVVGRLFLVADQGARPAIDLTARVELPTGDEIRGLGMGKASTEIGLELTKLIGPSLIALTSASYTVTSVAGDVQVQNPWEYSVGVGAYPIRSVLLSLSYEQWRSVIPGVPTGRDVLAGATIAAGRLRILASAQFPLADQAPDFGAGAGLAVRF